MEVLDAREPGTSQLRGPEIDRIVVDISLSVGEDFTARTAYTGLYGLAMLDLNFRVSCSETYFGEDCAIKCTGVSGQSECNDEGELRCIGNRNQSTGCVQCVSGYRGDSCDGEFSAHIYIQYILQYECHSDFIFRARLFS